MMGDLDQEIQAAFEAISLLLVFVAVLFSTRYPQISEDRQLAPTENGADARRRLRDRLRRSLLVNCLPLVLINGAVFYLFLPLAVRIVRESVFDPWGFDFPRTSFLVIAGLVLFFLAWSAYLAVQLGTRIRKYK